MTTNSINTNNSSIYFNSSIYYNITNQNPNVVLFKTDTGQLIFLNKLPDKEEFDWVNVNYLKVDGNELSDYYNLSSKNPFEYMFCWWDGNNIKVNKQKTILTNTSFSSLYDDGILQDFMNADYNLQFGSTPDQYSKELDDEIEKLAQIENFDDEIFPETT